VLYKSLPPVNVIDPRAFASRPDLYRAAFENEQVLILEPRETKGSG